MSQSEANTKGIEYTDVLFDCMQKRVDLARNLSQLNQTQTAAALENQTDALMGILARKQGLLDALGEIQEKLQPYLSDDPEARIWGSEDRREQCRVNAEESQRLLGDLMRAEKATLDEVTARREAIGALLRDGMDAISTRDAYAQSAPSGSRLNIGGI